jgi:hypothetical protein
MGGSVPKFIPDESLAAYGIKSVHGKKKKNKGDELTPQQRKNKAAKSAQPLLQQTALSPDDKPAGAGTALL